MIVEAETARAGRPLRRLALSLVPPKQLNRLRSLYERITTPGSRISGEVTSDGDALMVTMRSPAPSFRAVPESRWGVEEHLQHPRQSAELAAFVAAAATPGTLFDVGANDGLFSILYCLMHPANRVVAFEPSHALCDRFHRNTRLNDLADRITLLPVALGDRAGRQAMITNANDGYVQVTEFRGNEASEWYEAVIETTTLDAQCETCQPTIVKIDVEGFELEVLQGASVLLSRIRPVVFLELHLNFLEERGIPPVAVLQLLRAHAYEIYDLAGTPLSDRKAVRSWAPAVHLIARPSSRTRPRQI